MRSIKKLKNIKGKVVLFRADFNLSIKNGVVEDDFRVKKAIPSIKLLKSKGAKVVLISHLGKGGETLAPVVKSLNKFIKAKFINQVVGDEVKKAVSKMSNGEVILLENLRNDPGEKDCSKIFAMSLASLADIYVNEAFPVSHREDASIVLIPKMLPSYAGIQLEDEIKNLSKVLKKPKHPFLFILGGAKFSTKMPLINKYLKLSDEIFIGGALLNDFLKAKGYEVGESLVDGTTKGLEKIIKNKKIILPEYVKVLSNGNLIEKKVSQVKKGESIIDIGEQSINEILPYINKAKLILWNGPLGKYESGGGGTTKSILKLISKSKAESIIGGGDTVVLISELNMEKKFTFVSTGGGATLDFLANGTLPGIKALQ